jgi:hypothetical protein
MHYILLCRENKGRNMPSLQVREMPAALYGRLREEAVREHRSIAQQAIVTLARGMSITEDQSNRRKILLKTITEAAVSPKNLKLSDAAGIVNEDRNR